MHFINKLFKYLRKIIVYGIFFNTMASVGYTLAKTIEGHDPIVYLTYMMISSIYTGSILLLFEYLFKIFKQTCEEEKHG